MKIIKTDPFVGGPRLTFSETPEGFDALIVANLARFGDVLFIARDEARMTATAEAVRFFADSLEVVQIPSWDCLPYDRVSPHGEVVSRRIDGLGRLLEPHTGRRGRVVLTTVSAALQRTPPRAYLRRAATTMEPGKSFPLTELLALLESHGFHRAETVMETGEYAVRGGIVDVFPAGRETPVRVDFFGDTVEQLRAFDVLSQRSGTRLERVTLKPVSELRLDEAGVARFRSTYRAQFGAPKAEDTLYEAISSGRRAAGMEHWLPLFHEHLETLFDYLTEASVVLDHQWQTAFDGRLEQINDYYQARVMTAGPSQLTQTPYNPLPPNQLYLDAEQWRENLHGRRQVMLAPFAVPETESGDPVVRLGGRPGHDFAEARANPEVNIYDALREHVAGLRQDKRRVLIAAWSSGARDRLATLLTEHGLAPLDTVETWDQVMRLAPGKLALAVLGMEHGFTAEGMAVITEQDILGDRLVRPSRRRLRAENFISEASSLSEGDLVVHIDHGIGRFTGLEAVTVGRASHDCLLVVYDGGDRLYVPVENIEVLSRYGSDQGGAVLDKLGGVAWQSRKAKLKNRIRDMADKLIKVAAQRLLQSGTRIEAPEGLYDEFCARFPFAETDDQLRAIAAVGDDLALGRPMDRLICGDVGFGKTEVALRAAFLTAMAGQQVAVVAPTTLLARQHFQSFSERFRGYPIRIGQLSRLVSARDARRVKEELASGTLDIVVGTHALLAEGIRFRDLGLLVIDEEQHFGVRHKERLKDLRAGVHVLTLTATPIPRTLQMSLTGVKDLSLIATPPVDRLAVRTFILPYDPVVVREAILREKFRGGQVFYVCPRIADMDKVARELADLTPEVRVGLAHGRMAPRELEAIMSAFAEGTIDLLLSTNIIESGIDMPSANTLVVHRADMFGLAQLYQLRGRVGRSKRRAYAYLTLPHRQKLPAAAEKRLHVMQSLDTLGAGFTLASHDLDIRGAGNLLGEEQSGHIKEVGVELYQQMLEEAVAAAKGEAAGDPEAGEEGRWSPQINVGTSVLIPEAYVADLNLRLGLYRRLSELQDGPAIDGFAAEMADRFGRLPEEVENLLKVVAIKLACQRAAIEKVDAGPKGAVVSFRHNRFANPVGLISFINNQVGTAKLRPDHKLVVMRNWQDAEQRLAGVSKLIETIAGIATAAETGR